MGKVSTVRRLKKNVTSVFFKAVPSLLQVEELWLGQTITEVRYQVRANLQADLVFFSVEILDFILFLNHPQSIEAF